MQPRNTLSRLVRAVKTELQAHDSITHNAERRKLLKRTTAAAAGVASAGAAMASGALGVPESNKGMGRPIPASEYGLPSKFEAHVKRRRTDVLVNRQNFSDWSFTPVQHQ